MRSIAASPPSASQVRMRQQRKLTQALKVGKVNVEMVMSPPWTPDRIVEATCTPGREDEGLGRLGKWCVFHRVAHCS